MESSSAWLQFLALTYDENSHLVQDVINVEHEDASGNVKLSIWIFISVVDNISVDCPSQLEQLWKNSKVIPAPRFKVKVDYVMQLYSAQRNSEYY